MSSADAVTTLDAWLDGLPRTRFGSRTREVPAFRTIGIGGFYLALLVTLGSGLATGRSPVVLSLVSIACGASFFGWALIRRAITGRETLVLLEHVWVALLCTGAVLVAVGAPVLTYLDVVALGLCAFLAVGRLGCLVVGCCHGQPSVIGIMYGWQGVDEGFPAALVGVRLFPVQLLEAAGIALIGLCGLAVLPFVPAGVVFTWFLLAYAVLRFGTEGLRGDERASAAGLSIARWAVIAQAGFALWLADPERMAGPAGVVLACVLVLLVVGAGAWRLRAPERVLRGAAVIAEARAFVAAAVCEGSLAPGGAPVSRSFPGGLSIAVSPPPAGGGRVHVSFALPADRRSLRLLCEVAAQIVPEVLAEGTSVSPAGRLHVVAEDVGSLPRPAMPDATARLYGQAIRSMQAEAVGRPVAAVPEPSSEGGAAAARPMYADVAGLSPGTTRRHTSDDLAVMAIQAAAPSPPAGAAPVPVPDERRSYFDGGYPGAASDRGGTTWLDPAAAAVPAEVTGRA